MRATRRGERGETLIELIVAVTIMGTSVVILVAALAAAVANATRQRIDAKGQAALNAYGERVRTVPFVPCATPGDYNRVLDLEGPADGSPDYAPRVTRVMSWDGARYLTGSTLAADVAAGTNEIPIAAADAAMFPTTPFAIRVDSTSTAAETLTVTGGFGSERLEVTPPAVRDHEKDAAVSLCPEPAGGSPHQAQLLDIGVTGPIQPGTDPAERYAVATTVAKRGPLNVPVLTAAKPVRILDPGDDTKPATARVGAEVILEFEATLAGATAPGGQITFSLFDAAQFDRDNGACRLPLFDSVPADVTDNGTVKARMSFTPPHAGVGVVDAYRWTAAYGGDDANEGATVTCGTDAQRIDVKASPRVVGRLVAPAGAPPTARPGDETAVTARLEEALTPTGKLRFTLHGPGADCTENTVAGPSEVDIVPNGETPSPPYTFADANAEGSYRWLVQYDGDDNNALAETCLSEEDQVVRFTP